MSDGLYEQDILAWSETQAGLLRRLGRGERVNDADWTNLAEEIESVGLSELHEVESFLTLILTHLLKLHAWPDSEARAHWDSEITGFQADAVRRFSPSMRQRIDIASLYATALKKVTKLDCSLRLPGECPFTLEQLLRDEVEVLLPLFPLT